MQILNVCTKFVYNSHGEEKVKWFKAGILKITDSGHKYLRLFHQPYTDFYVFEKDPTQDSLPIIDFDNITRQ